MASIPIQREDRRRLDLACEFPAFGIKNLATRRCEIISDKSRQVWQSSCHPRTSSRRASRRPLLPSQQRKFVNIHHTNNRVLLIESDPVHAKAIRDALEASGHGQFDVEWVSRLSEGLERLSKGGLEAILTELSLPDSDGIETLDRLLPVALHIPVLALGASHDPEIATQTVQHGAQDYLPKKHLDPHGLTRVLKYMIARKQTEDALFIEKERTQVTLNSIADGVLSTDVSGNVTYLNPVGESMTGWTQQEALGRPFAEVFRIIDGASREPARNPMDLAIERDCAVGLASGCILLRRGGPESVIEDSAAPIHDRLGRVTGAVIVFHDVNKSRAITEKMSHLAQHDFLTDLPNRLLLNDRITQAISFAQRHQKQLAILFLDLDRFKEINDSLGHVIGDKLLRVIAERLVASVRHSDTVSRQGGDEFVILLPQIEHAADAAISAQKMLNALAVPHRIGRNDLNVDASIGISTYPNDGQNAESLLKAADIAMYHAKDKGSKNYQFFRENMNVRAAEWQSLEALLRRALDRHEFVLHYQPQIDLETGAITGVEALVRVMLGDRGLVPPLQFVPIAEECGLIVPIGLWVLREACTQFRSWINVGLRPTSISVNISAWQLRADGFFESVCAILKETQMEPRFLEFELTESVLIEGASTISILEALKSMGVRLAIDDFGTGYSSLSYLRKLPIDALKLDQTFVHEITADPESAPIARAVISMGNSLKKRIIAEGVETREQLDFLRGQNCPEGQGFYFSKPVAAEQFGKLLRAGLASSVTH
jgi:diguanylate cyclase (GGDEF)-like protein/PAS domain S-box-containing protein